jgi:hypothetical protein
MSGALTDREAQPGDSDPLESFSAYCRDCSSRMMKHPADAGGLRQSNDLYENSGVIE